MVSFAKTLAKILKHFITLMVLVLHHMSSFPFVASYDHKFFFGISAD